MTQRTPDILGAVMNPQPKPNPLALTVPEKFTRPEWERFGHNIATADRHFRLAVGDWVLAGEREWGNVYAEAEEITGQSYQYLADCVYVARHMQISLRDEKLNWSQMKLIAKAPDDEKAGWVATAVEEGLTKRQLADRMKPVTVMTVDEIIEMIWDYLDREGVGSSEGRLAFLASTNSMVFVRNPPQGRKIDIDNADSALNIINQHLSEKIAHDRRKAATQPAAPIEGEIVTEPDAVHIWDGGMDRAQVNGDIDTLRTSVHRDEIPPAVAEPYSDTRLRAWLGANMPEFLFADPVASAINAMGWMKNEIARLTIGDPAPDPVPPVVSATPDIDLPNWAYGWDDDDQAQYDDIGVFWTIERITRPRVALRYVAEEGADMFPSLLKHYQALEAAL